MSSIDPGSARSPSEGLPSPAGGKVNGDGLSTPQLVVDGHSGTGTPLGFQRFPHNKHLDHVVRTPGRQPSPQPTHLGIPGTHHRVLSEEDPGYIAATFEGKQKQMEEGEHRCPPEPRTQTREVEGRRVPHLTIRV